MSGGIERLVALSAAAGNGFDEAGHAAEPTIYAMERPMAEDVRAAGEDDASLAYTQTLGQEPLQEGFIDEASETMILFPFAPEAIAQAHAEMAARATTWRFGLAMILAAAGGAELIRALFYGAFDVVRFGAGFVVLAAAVLLFRSDRRRKRLAVERSRQPPPP